MASGIRAEELPEVQSGIFAHKARQCPAGLLLTATMPATEGTGDTMI